jgi:hypothetical protein
MARSTRRPGDAADDAPCLKHWRPAAAARKPRRPIMTDPKTPLPTAPPKDEPSECPDLDQEEAAEQAKEQAQREAMKRAMEYLEAGDPAAAREVLQAALAGEQSDTGGV